MPLFEIIKQYDERLTSCGLSADVRHFHSPFIRAISYQGYIGITRDATDEEAHEMLQFACRFVTSPADVGMRLAKRLHLVHGVEDGPVVIWRSNSFSHPSNKTT